MQTGSNRLPETLHVNALLHFNQRVLPLLKYMREEDSARVSTICFSHLCSHTEVGEGGEETAMFINLHMTNFIMPKGRYVCMCCTYVQVLNNLGIDPVHHPVLWELGEK